MAKTYSKDDVVKAWGKVTGRENYFEVRETESAEGLKVTQLISAGGSLTAQVNAQGAEAYKRLVEEAGSPFIDPGVNPADSVSDDNKVYTSKHGTPAFPTQPEAITGAQEATEIDHRDSVAPGAHTVDGPAKASGTTTTDVNRTNVGK